MERLPVQSALWRGFALLFVALLALMAGKGFAVTTGWEAARALYWLIAPLGLLGYAFGFRLLSVTFWRVYAALVTAEITIRIAPFAWLPISRALGQADSSRHGNFIILFASAGVALTCLALFRYAKILGGGRTEMDQPSRCASATLASRIAHSGAFSTSVKALSTLVKALLRLALVALVAAAPAALLLAALLSATGGGSAISLAAGFLSVLPFVFVGLVLASPFLLLRRALNRRFTADYLMIGALVGAAVGGYTGYVLRTSPVEPITLEAAVWCAAIGAVYGLWGGNIWAWVFRRRHKHSRSTS